MVRAALKPSLAGCWVAFVAFGGVACSSETGPMISGGQTSTGSIGAQSSAQSSTSGGPTCAKCVHVASPGGLDTTSDTLPVGTCCADESPCQQIVRPCPMGGPSYYYTCACDASSWCCRLTSQDGSICVPPGFQPEGGWPPTQQGT